jgi:AcrR family transcriptional regulator
VDVAKSPLVVIDVPRGAGRPRSDAVRTAVLAAAYELLLNTPLGGFSIDAVALRAGVARTTIYRWWPTKGLLAIESFLDGFKPKLSYTVGDDPEKAFRKLLASLARALSGPDGLVAASVVAQAQSDPETQRMFREQFSDPLRVETSKLIEAGLAQGRFRADLDVPRVIDAAVGAIYLRLLLGQTLDARWADSLADMLLGGMVTR